MSVTATPADQAAAHDRVAAENLAKALRVADRVIGSTDYEDATRTAAWGCRMLLLGAMSDPQLSSRVARMFARRILRDLARDDSYTKGARTVYRRCLAGLDGKLD